MVKIYPQSNGPQIPQIQPPPPPPRRKSCCCLIFQLCFFLVAAILSILLITVVVLAIIFGSRREVEVTVTDGYLTNFDLKTTTNDTFLISYNMSFNIMLTNPNTKISVYYDVVKAYAYYAAKPFAAVTLPAFFQGHKTTNMLRVVFEGNETLSFDNSDVEFLTWFGDEKKAGVFSITVVLDFSVRTKYGKIKYRQNQNYVYCYLRIPLTSMKGKFLYSTFRATQCGIVHIIT